MKDDLNDPKVIAYRLAAVEQKLDSVSTTLEHIGMLVSRNSCPEPGACLRLAEAHRDMKTLVEKHDHDLQEIKIALASAKASLRTIVFVATSGGSVLGAVISFAITYLTKS